MYQGLSLDQAPPYSVPLRFFLTAPLFMIGIGLFFLWGDREAIFVRHTSESIVLIHALSLGFASMVMMGALTQMLPVLAGVKYPKALELTSLIHLALTIGIVLFLYGYYTYQPEFMIAASLMLLFSLGIFAITTLTLLMRAKHTTPTIWAMRLATVAFLLTILLGAHLLVSHATGNLGDDHTRFVLVHLTAGGIGWVLLLVIGVGFQVVPMFWVTSPYSGFCKRFVLPVTSIVIVFMAVDLLVWKFFPDWLFGVLLFIPMGSFSLTTLLKLYKRKRKLPDVAVNYWILSMVSLFTAGVILILHLLLSVNLEALFFILFGFGFVVSVITGMLYKIIPFLAWFHLSSQGVMEAPTMREMISPSLIQWQWFLYLMALICLMISLITPHALLLAGILLMVSSGLLFWNLAKAASIYFNMRPTDAA